MGRALTHRGPDSRRVIQHGPAQLGCTRLRIVDLSQAADGPFHSACGQVSLTCNGEVYNSDQLRAKYANYPYASGSDLEVIFPLYLDKGVEGLSELIGMYAIALWDARSNRLVLMRDRSGEKPLFYSDTPSQLLFASEMKALLDAPTVSRQLDQESLTDYLQLGYVRSPRTIFRDIAQVPAGVARVIENGTVTESRYWPPAAKAEPTGRRANRGNPSELMQHLRTAVRRQATADVKRGVYLSGGLDSSLIAALLSEVLQPDDITGFTVRFEASSFDESNWALTVAKRLGINTETVTLNEATLARTWERAIQEVADPISDPALLPTIALGEAARSRVSVVYSGEGADELFGGYPTYLGHSLAVRFATFPGFAQQAVSSFIERLPASHDKVTLSFLAKRFIGDVNKPWLERHLRWFGPAADRFAHQQRPIADAVGDLRRSLAGLPVAQAAMMLDYQTYLRDNLLVKLDRGTMLSSVESRAPFLDPDVIRYAWNLPMRDKIQGTRTKALLKRAALEVLPRNIVHRRKRGLSLPIAAWINGGLRTEVDRLLDPNRLDRQGMFKSRDVTSYLEQHRAGAADHSRTLWNLIHLQRWIEVWAPSQA